jgi:NitT/TauT family transport system substrate-binding protein
MKKNRLFLVIAVCFCLSAMGFTGANASGAAYDLKVGYNPWVGDIGVFTAQDKHFFEAGGLNVKLVSFSGPAESTQALLSGKLDVALTTLDNAVIMANKVQNRTLKIVYIIDRSNGADAIVVNPKIHSLADLKGKKIGVSIGQVNHFLLLKAFEKAGLKESAATLVNMNSDTAGAAFLAGKLDAAVTWEPYLSNAVNSGKGKIIFSSKDAPGAIVDVAVVAPAISEKKLSWVKSFLETMEKGRKYSAEHEDDAAKIASKYLEVEPGEIKGMIKTVKLFTYEENKGILKENGLIGKSLAEMEAFFKARKMITEPVNIKALIENQYFN